MRDQIERVIKELEAAKPKPKKNKNFTSQQAGVYSALQFAIEKLHAIL